MHLTRRSLGLIPLLIAAAIVLSGEFARATFTLHDASQDPSTGVYTYTVQLDAAGNVLPNDGFVIYDFPGLTSWTLTGGLDSSQFSLNQTLNSNTLTAATSVDAIANNDAITNGITFDSSVVPNLSFDYVGPPIPLLGTTVATLTLTTSDLGGDTTSVYGGVDHSGPDASVPFSFATNPVTVPTAIPEPASSLGVVVLASAWATRRNRRSRH